MDARAGSCLFPYRLHNDTTVAAAQKQHGILLEDVLSGLRPSSVAFNTANNDNKPGFALLDMASRYLFELNESKDEFDALDDKVKKTILQLGNTCVQVQKTVTEFEDKRNQFEVNIDLNNQKYEYLAQAKQSENNHQIALSKYRIAVSKIQDDIDLFNMHIKEVNAAVSESEIKELEIYGKIQQEIAAQLEVANNIINSVDSFHHFFCFVPERVKRAHKKINELESRRVVLNSAALNDLKNHITALLESDISEMQDELVSLSKLKPVRDEQSREKYIQVEARVRSDEFEYYSSVNHELMLGFVRLHFMINKVQHGLHNENNENIKQLFARFKKSFVSMSAGFYCEEPGRFYFDYYLKNMHAIKDGRVVGRIVGGEATGEEVGLGFIKDGVNVLVRP